MREFSAYPEAEMARLMAPMAMREAQRWRGLWGGAMTPDEERGAVAAREAREASRARWCGGRTMVAARTKRDAARAKRYEAVDRRTLGALTEEWISPKALAEAMGESAGITAASLYRLHEKGLVLRNARTRSDITWRSL